MVNIDVTNVGFAPTQTAQPAPNPLPQPQDGFFPELQPMNRPESAPEGNRPQRESPTPTKEELAKQLEIVNSVMRGLNVNLSFGVLESTGNLYAKVIDRKSGDTIKVLPSVEFLQLKDKLARQIEGFLEDRLA